MEDIQTARALSDDDLYAALYQADPGSRRNGILQMEANRRQYLASRRAAEAADGAAQATARYARYTLWLVVLTAAAVAAAWLAVIRSS